MFSGARANVGPRTHMCLCAYCTGAQRYVCTSKTFWPWLVNWNSYAGPAEHTHMPYVREWHSKHVSARHSRGGRNNTAYNMLFRRFEYYAGAVKLVLITIIIIIIIIVRRLRLKRTDDPTSINGGNSHLLLVRGDDGDDDEREREWGGEWENDSPGIPFPLRPPPPPFEIRFAHTSRIRNTLREPFRRSINNRRLLLLLEDDRKTCESYDDETLE